MIRIECPHCNKDNCVRLPENAECRHCKRSLNGHSFNAKPSKSRLPHYCVWVQGLGISLKIH